jgi:tRNA-2-methylthio-N6-dimethylallyladenosine synthase
MNRGYSVGQYLEFIDRVEHFLPDAGIAGDIIVGFPTETEADFEATCDLVRRVPFKNNFVFKYSPRPGTVAINRFPDDVPEDVKRLRINQLLDIQSEVSRRVHEREIGRIQNVFVEKLGQSRPQSGPVQLGWEKSTVQLSGRTSGDMITVFDVVDSASAAAFIGHIVPVKVDSAAPRLLMGSLVEPSKATAVDNQGSTVIHNHSNLGDLEAQRPVKKSRSAHL